MKLGSRGEGEPGGNWSYREAVSSVSSMSTMTMPGTSDTVRAVARHTYNNPTARHWKAVMTIMAYIHKTKSMKLTFVPGGALSECSDQGFCSSSWLKVKTPLFAPSHIQMMPTHVPQIIYYTVVIFRESASLRQISYTLYYHDH